MKNNQNYKIYFCIDYARNGALCEFNNACKYLLMIGFFMIFSNSASVAEDLEMLHNGAKEILLLDKTALYKNGWFVDGTIKIKRPHPAYSSSYNYKLAIADVKADCVKSNLQIESVSYFGDELGRKSVEGDNRSVFTDVFMRDYRDSIIQRLCSEQR